MPRLFRDARYLSLIELTYIGYALKHIVPTHTSGTLSKGNFLDNIPNRDESCVDS